MRISREFPLPEQVASSANVVFEHEDGSRRVYVAEIAGRMHSVPARSEEGVLVIGRVVTQYGEGADMPFLASRLRGFSPRIVATEPEV